VTWASRVSWGPGAVRFAAAGAATSPANTTSADEDQAVGLREAHQHHLPEITRRPALCRANDPSFPNPAGKRGVELLYRVGD
jgi:hypothetical protein